MFSKSTRWEAMDESTELNHAPPKTNVPKKTLRDKQGSTLISIYRYRIIYEPCIPDDNFCCLDVNLSTLNDFLVLSKNKLDCREKTDTSCKWIFTIGKDAEIFRYYLDTLEDFLLQTANEYKKNLNTEFNKLRDFCNFSPRIIHQNIVDDMSDEKKPLTHHKAYHWFISDSDTDGVSDEEKEDISSDPVCISGEEREDTSDPDSINDEEMAYSVFSQRYRMRNGYKN